MEHPSFDTLGLSQPLLRAVAEMGFEETTSIQSSCIPLILEGSDVIGHSQTGTGKTAAFGLPALQKVDRSKKNVQVLVLCPTRELALQACDEFRKFSKYLPGAKSTAIFGGQQIERQIKALKDGAQIVIGTPGRVIDHLGRRTMDLSGVSVLVLDEADEMLDMGFRDDIDKIISFLPQQRQTLLFSATMSKPILDLVRKYQTNPNIIKTASKELTVPSIDQSYFDLPKNKRADVLAMLIDQCEYKLSMVFCNTKAQVDELVDELLVRGVAASGIHGDMNQQVRTHVMELFRAGKTEVLVATDVAARGIDVFNVEAVFNYDLPQDMEYYVHRIGRTGRAGKTGRAYTFVSGAREIRQLKEISRFTNARIHLAAPPSDNEMLANRASKLHKKIDKLVKLGGLEKYVQIIDDLTVDKLSTVDVAAALLRLYLGDVFEDPKKKDDKHKYRGRIKMARLRINLGEKNEIAAKHIVAAVAQRAGISGRLVGSIKVKDRETFFEVPKEFAEDVLAALKNAKIRGQKIDASIT